MHAEPTCSLQLLVECNAAQLRKRKKVKKQRTEVQSIRQQLHKRLPVVL